MKQVSYNEGDKVILTPDARLIPYGYRRHSYSPKNMLTSSIFPLVIAEPKATMYSMLILKKIVGTVLYQTGDEYVSVDNVVYPYYMVKWKVDDNSSKTGVICAFSLTPFIENTQVNEIILFEL